MMFRFLLLLCLGHYLLGADSQQRRKSHACIGDNVTLLCDGPTDTANKNIQWIFEGRHAGYVENERWVAQNNFVTRTGLVSIENRNFSLVIYSVRKEDKGEYRCDVGDDEQWIELIVVDDHVCRTNREREDPPGSETDKQDPDENLPGPPPGVIVVIVLVVLVVVAVGAAVLIKLWRKQQTDENPTDCIQVFHACGKEGEKKRGKNLPDPGPSEDALL